MVKNSLTNKITPCGGLPFSVVYWWISNLTLNSEADRQFILSKISQTGIISIDAWKVLINSGTLEAGASLTKAEFLAWFDCGKQPTRQQLKVIIESFKIANWTPETELPANIATVDKVQNGVDYIGNVYTKPQTDAKINQAKSEMDSGLNLGFLKPTSAAAPATGIHRGQASEAGTYTNFKDAANASIIVTAADLDIVNGVANNRVILEVSEGVATKWTERVKGDAAVANPVFNPANNTEAPTMKAARDYFVNEQIVVKGSTTFTSFELTANKITTSNVQTASKNSVIKTISGYFDAVGTIKLGIVQVTGSGVGSTAVVIKDLGTFPTVAGVNTFDNINEPIEAGQRVATIGGNVTIGRITPSTGNFFDNYTLAGAYIAGIGNYTISLQVTFDENELNYKAAKASKVAYEFLFKENLITVGDTIRTTSHVNLGRIYFSTGQKATEKGVINSITGYFGEGKTQLAIISFTGVGASAVCKIERYIGEFTTVEGLNTFQVNTFIEANQYLGVIGGSASIGYRPLAGQKFYEFLQNNTWFGAAENFVFAISYVIDRNETAYNIQKRVPAPARVITTFPEIITVGKLDGRFNTIMQAVTFAKSSGVEKTIQISPGIYNEHIDLYGAYKKISLIGVAKGAVTVLQEDTDYYTPPLHVNNNAYFENMIFKSTADNIPDPPPALSASYAAHSDYFTLPNILIEYFNCDFIQNTLTSQAYGAGSAQGQTLRFRNCKFNKNNTVNAGSMYWHNAVANNVFLQRLEMLFCEIYANGGPTIQLHDANQTNGGNFPLNPALSEAKVMFIGNTFYSGDTPANNSLMRQEGDRAAGALVGNIFLDPRSHGNNITALNF